MREVPEHVIATSSFKENGSPAGGIPPGGREIMYYVYQCLFSPGVSERVTSVVMEMTLELLGETDTHSTDSSEVHMYMYLLGLLACAHARTHVCVCVCVCVCVPISITDKAGRLV